MRWKNHPHIDAHQSVAWFALDNRNFILPE
jgi:hypothetical protein